MIPVLTNEDKEWIATATRESEDRIMTALRSAISESEQRITGKITEIEVKLLTEFHEWATRMDQKLRTHREALRSLDLQIEALAGRVGNLEQARDPLQ